MLLQLCACVLMLDLVVGNIHFNALDGLRRDRATVKMGESVGSSLLVFGWSRMPKARALAFTIAKIHLCLHVRVSLQVSLILDII